MQLEDYETAAATFTAYIKDGRAASGAESIVESVAEPVETEAAEVSNLGAYYYRAVCEGAIGNLENGLHRLHRQRL